MKKEIKQWEERGYKLHIHHRGWQVYRLPNLALVKGGNADLPKHTKRRKRSVANLKLAIACAYVDLVIRRVNAP
jgi:hypothetical protein